MIRVMIADDHKIVRQGLRQMLALAPDIAVVGEAAHGQQVMGLLGEPGCDIVLLDLTMPGPSGVELIARIKTARDAPRILVLSMHNEGGLVTRALKAGAEGFLTKDSDPEMLIGAIRKVAHGGRYIDPSLVDQVVFDHGLGGAKTLHEKLTDREFQILQMLVAGQTVGGIADALSLSAKTVSTHKLRMLQKMNMHTMAELFRYAIDHKLV